MGTMGEGWCQWKGKDAIVRVRVSSRASGDTITAEADHLKIRITAPPVDGRANAHVRKLLAELFDVPKSRVVLERGTKSRIKTFRISAPGTRPAI